jgi:hypothetical protein
MISEVEPRTVHVIFKSLGSHEEHQLRQSSLKVNQNKTEACLLYKHDVAPIKIRVGDATIATKSSINVLGVVCDSKLRWDLHISKVCDKANTSINVLKLIKILYQ